MQDPASESYERRLVAGGRSWKRASAVALAVGLGMVVVASGFGVELVMSGDQLAFLVIVLSVVLVGFGLASVGGFGLFNQADTDKQERVRRLWVCAGALALVLAAVAAVAATAIGGVVVTFLVALLIDGGNGLQDGVPPFVGLLLGLVALAPFLAAALASWFGVIRLGSRALLGAPSPRTLRWSLVAWANLSVAPTVGLVVFVAMQ